MSRELGFHSAHIIDAQWDDFANFVSEKYQSYSDYIASHLSAAQSAAD